MKQILSIAIMLIMAFSAMGQTFHPCTDCDTITGSRDKKYFYGEWYDTCHIYRYSGYTNSSDTCRTDTFILSTPMEGSHFARPFHVDSPMAVKGLSCMVDIYAGGELFQDTTKLPEYLYLYQYVGPDSLLWERMIENDLFLKLDSVRWDTVKPHYLKLPVYADSSEYRLCYLYDVYFKSPVYVDSSFFVAGTVNSNVRPDNGSMAGWAHIPTVYRAMQRWTTNNCPLSYSECETQYWGRAWVQRMGNAWYPYPNVFGYYFPIVDNHYLTVLSDSTDLGEVRGGGLFPDMSLDTIEALARPGCRFLHWNDGNTDNPRVIRLTQDTTFTAYFVENEHFEVHLSVNNPEWGSVEGDGSYAYGTQVTISATPTDGNSYFAQWSDGDWSNPRTFTITQDTTFTAIFFQTEGVDAPLAGRLDLKVSPNPTRGLLSLRLGTCDSYRCEVYSDKGERVAEHLFNGDNAVIDISYLPSGHYILKVQGKGGMTTKGFVKR